MNITRLMVSEANRCRRAVKLDGIEKKAAELLSGVSATKDKYGRAVQETAEAAIVNQKNGGKIVSVKGMGESWFDKQGSVVREKLPNGDEYIYCPNGDMICLSNGFAGTKTSAEVYTSRYPKGVSFSTIAEKDCKKYSKLDDLDTGKERIFVTDRNGQVRQLNGIGDLFDETMGEITLKESNPFVGYSPSLLKSVLDGKI